MRECPPRKKTLFSDTKKKINRPMKFRFSTLRPSFKRMSLVASLLTVVAIIPGSSSAQVAPLLSAQKPIVVPGGAGGYDWMQFDAKMNRVLAGHKGKGTLVVLDLNGNRITSVPVGAAQGIAIDEADGKYFVGDADEQKIVVVDRKTLKITGQIPVTGPVDAMAFDTKRGLVYAGHDDGTEVWVIDGKSNKVVGSVKISGAPEYIEYDSVTDRLYQNVKTDDTLHVIDSDKKAAEFVWKTTPATGPHGLAVSGKTGRVFCAGKNGKLVALDIRTGKTLAIADIAPGVDQIALDHGNQYIYSACKGFISVTEVTKSGLRSRANIPSPGGVHTLTVDPKTHTVWACYADKTDSYLIAFVTK